MRWIAPLLMIGLCVACAPKLTPTRVLSIRGEMIPITADIQPNARDVAFLEPYKTALDRAMSETIGCAADRLEVTPHKPENKLSNFAVDMVLRRVSQENGGGVDLAMLNVGGLRAPIAKGAVSVRDVFSVFPFDNRLALVYIQGKYLRQCLPAYLRRANGISNAQLELRPARDSLFCHLLIAGKPLEDEKEYAVATIDYLAEGNDGFVGFSSARQRIIYDISLRDAALLYVREQKAKGLCLDAPIEGRVRIVEEKR